MSEGNNKFWRLKYTSRADRFTRKLKGLQEFLRKRLNADTEETIKRVIKIVVGWLNYHAISDNGKRASAFLHWSRRILFWWINRRGGRKPMNWERFNKMLDRLKFPKIYKTVSMFPNVLNRVPGTHRAIGNRMR